MSLYIYYQVNITVYPVTILSAPCGRLNLSNGGTRDLTTQRLGNQQNLRRILEQAETSLPK